MSPLAWMQPALEAATTLHTPLLWQTSQPQEFPSERGRATQQWLTQQQPQASQQQRFYIAAADVSARGWRRLAFVGHLPPHAAL
jgi:hypothetical protein